MSTEHMEELNDQQIVRREKMAALREQGIDPFGKRFERTANSQELKDKFAELDKEQLHELNETATIAGRLVSKRGKGKSASPIFKTEKVKSKSTFVKMLLVKKTMKSLRRLISVTSSVSKVKSCVQIWESSLSRQLTLHTCLKHFAHFQRNSTV